MCDGISNRFVTGSFQLLLVAVATVSTFPATSRGACAGDPAWLKAKAPLALFSQPPPPRHNAPDCPFYQAAWQVFLYATAPEKGEDGKTVPRFLTSPDFSTIEETFGSKFTRAFPVKGDKFKGFLSVAPMTRQRANRAKLEGTGAEVGGGVDQAGSDSCVVDQNGNPIFFAIHFNRTLESFFINNHLLTPEDVKLAQQATKFQTLTFDDGAIELKSAWQIVWSTFEHVANVDGQQIPDIAPSAEHNPVDGQKPQKLHRPLAAKYTLFPALPSSGSEVPASANQIPTSQQISDNFDAGKQTFTKAGTTFTTPIYREFWTSKMSEDGGIDDDILALNQSMTDTVFTTADFDHANDKRDHYRLIGAVWMDDPDGISNFEKRFVYRRAITNFVNGTEVGSDDPNAVVAGEDRLSGAAMESFTQKSTDNPNCFSCHDTGAIRPKVGPPVLRPSLSNVSHILSRFLLNAPEPPAHP